MSAMIIDGTAEAARLRQEVATQASQFTAQTGRQPGLAVILVGDDPASAVYVRTKAKQAVACGIRSFEHRLSAITPEADLLRLVDQLNDDPEIDGILVQLPLPSHIVTDHVLERVHPNKDVDCFHPINAGRLANGTPTLTPCTPTGCLRLIKLVRPNLRGLDALVIGRSTLVGRPMAQLLLIESCTVTLAHSGTRDLPAYVKRADIVVAAIGRPNFVQADWLKPGATVIDVGINRIAGSKTLVGDEDFQASLSVAGAITPVPGGVGPMTVATLLANTLRCARLRLV
jgi:methylenetetrahydrofolate dehydrogenase (NADP+)/methenyltetrahydrofolate cyclohydrolase